jgi:hypothetical protein
LKPQVYIKGNKTMPKNNPPILSYWNSSGEPINPRQMNALKVVLTMAGATSVTKKRNGSVQATFASWSDLEKADKNIMTPLQRLFEIKTIESTFGTVVF